MYICCIHIVYKIIHQLNILKENYVQLDIRPFDPPVLAASGRGEMLQRK